MKIETNIVPFPGYALVEAIEDDKIGSFVVVKDDREQPVKGRVMATGDEFDDFKSNADYKDVLYFETPVEAGDIIVFKKYANQELTHNGNQYLMVEWKDIMGVIK